ncbi:helicase-associated domain-containing protein [Streptomyces sp. NPDC002073]
MDQEANVSDGTTVPHPAGRTPGGSGTPAAAGAAPRSLAEALRARDDASLAGLLRARPDLLGPVPADLTQLATRAGTRASVVRALERLNRFALQAAEALAVAPDPCPYGTLEDLMTGDDDGMPGTAAIRAALPDAVATLRDQALLWGDDQRLRLVRTAREILAPSASRPSPTGLGPTVAEATAGMSPGRVQEIVASAGLSSTHDPVSAVAALTALFTDHDRMSALLDEAPAEAHVLLGRLVWGPPYGEVTANPAQPVRWLRDRGLLLPISARTVVLPREVALYLRGGRAHRSPEPVAPPVPAAHEHRPQLVDANAAGQALAAIGTVEDLLGLWEHAGPLVLRAGGLSVRDLKRAAVSLDVTEPVAAFWIELCYAAGLLASDGEADERYAPTPAYDDWLALPPEERWAELAVAWLPATRTAGLVGDQDAKGRTLSVLGPDLDRSAAPEVRRRVLGMLAALPPGGAPDCGAVLERLAWERPVRSMTELRTRLAHWTLDEAELLGVTGRGALTSHGRALLGEPADGPGAAARAGTEGAPGGAARGATVGTVGGAVHGSTSEIGDAGAHGSPVGGDADARTRAAVAALLGPLLPEPVDHVLLQADLTAVAPGPLERHLAETLAVLADVESKGGATVYRFTPGSVRRALDSGRTATDLQDFLVEHSRTPVPQPLSYLIDDVARRHGHLRVGAASSYVRCDDDSVLGEILADKRSAGLGLRRLAPTVLASSAEPGALLDGLRALGYPPAAESATGDVLVARAAPHRTPERSAPVPVPDGPTVPDPALLGAAVRAIRAGDAAATAVRKEPAFPDAATAAAVAAGGLPRTSAAETLATVQAAAMTGTAVLIGYVNAEGSASQRVIAPVRVEGGFVTGYDHTADDVRTYALHRITGVAELADDQA